MEQAEGPPTVVGRAVVFFAFDVGLQIDLGLAAKLSGAGTAPRFTRVRRPAPSWFDYNPPPLRLSASVDSVEGEGWRSGSSAEVLIYDFGSVLISMEVPFELTFALLPAFAKSLDGHEGLAAAARREAERVLGVVLDSVREPELAAMVEDYLVFVLEPGSGGADPLEVVAAHRLAFAGLLQADDSRLSEPQVSHSLSGEMSYTPSDLAIIGWNAAVVFDPEPGDVIAVLQHANVELLEMRLLDERLDGLLERSGELLGRISRSRVFPFGLSGREMRWLAEAQTDSALMFEGVNNAIKLVGDQYLSRLYQRAGEKLHLPEWDASVLRKLETLESVYQKMSDTKGTIRLETLEWIIILLILISILLPYLPSGYGK